MEKGFKDSAFRLNNYVKQCDRWTETELRNRQYELLDVFMKLWPMPSTSFVPLDKEIESAPLEEDDVEFAGKRLQAFRFRGVRYVVNTWKEMLVQVCNHIVREKRSTVEWLCANGKGGFSSSPDYWRREIGPNLYVWTDNSTAHKVGILRGLFDECNIPESELIFEFRSDAVESE